MGHTILVAEDEEAIRQVLTEMLGIVDDGYEVDVAVDGQEALDKIRAKSYSILLSDIMMPRMNGMQLLEVLAREFPELPVIIITGVREEKNVLGCLASGAWDYILKPFDVAQVRAAARRALAISKNRRGGPTGLKVVSSGPGWLELTASSEVEYLRRFRKFTEVLLGARLTASDREDIRLAIEELGRNAIEWGNRSQEGKKVHLSYGLFYDRVVFKIEDEGEGFIPKEVPDPSVNPIAHVERRRNDGKRPGGYGIHIVRKLVDELEYNEKGNGVCLTKYLM